MTQRKILDKEMLLDCLKGCIQNSKTTETRSSFELILEAVESGKFDLKDELNESPPITSEILNKLGIEALPEGWVVVFQFDDGSCSYAQYIKNKGASRPSTEHLREVKDFLYGLYLDGKPVNW